ncbi:beta-microseminoprotein J1 [Limanda limanda]|uniref:beta-microseminoprotein J1 n=1 Tax=Limanda limanda TaxID=27771 RepID=UPI0029C82A86|nr:beta-microseminoprotein J1 [Limanda limanda]
MALLRVIVCLLGLVVLCHSDCTFVELVITDVNNPPNGCVDQDGTHKDFDTEWVTDCVAYSCTSEGLSSCNLLPSPAEVEVSDECELIVNEQECSSKVVLKSDNTKECSPN